MMPPFNGISSGLSVRKFAIREEHLLDCTHFIASLLESWKVAVVRTEYDYAIFPCHFKNVHTRNCS